MSLTERFMMYLPAPQDDPFLCPVLVFRLCVLWVSLRTPRDWSSVA